MFVWVLFSFCCFENMGMFLCCFICTLGNQYYALIVHIFFYSVVLVKAPCSKVIIKHCPMSGFINVVAFVCFNKKKKNSAFKVYSNVVPGDYVPWNTVNQSRLLRMLMSICYFTRLVSLCVVPNWQTDGGRFNPTFCQSAKWSTSFQCTCRGRVSGTSAPRCIISSWNSKKSV